MKRIKVALILLVIVLNLTFLCGCSLFGFPRKSDPPISTVDGYEVYDVTINKEKCYAIIGVNDRDIINGVWTVPKTIGNRKVYGLGYDKEIYLAGYTNFSLNENDKIKKIVINHKLELSQKAFINLKDLREVQICEEVYFYKHINMFGDVPIYSLTITKAKNRVFVNDLDDLVNNMTPDLRCIKLLQPNLQAEIDFLHPDRIIAYFLPDAKSIIDVFSRYASLSAFIVEGTVREISEKSFENSSVDVYVRYTQDNCPQGLRNGWDNGVNVTWGFEDEIVIFDSLFGSEIVFESTGKNYVTAQVGNNIVPPTNPTREGYKFTGWYKDYTCMELWDFETDTVTTSTVLVAGWQQI